MEIRQQILTKNECYIVGAPMKPKGVLWHSTGANNPKLTRYVPDDGKLGPNRYNNHWDQPRPGGRQVCVHAFIGQDKNKDVRIYQTLPFDMRCWGAGSGPKGSANDGYIQFEICEDNLKNKEYFDEVYKAGVWFTAEMVKRYKLDVNATTIIDHSGAHKMGIASNHGDVMHWFRLYGKTMADVIKDVKDLLDPKPAPAPSPQPTPQPSLDFKVGQKVEIKSSAKTYSRSTASIGAIYKGNPYTIQQVGKDDILIQELYSWVRKTDVQTVELSSKDFFVRVTAHILNVRSGPGLSNRVNTTVRQREVFTIVEEQNGWGRLKSGAGWISLSYTEKV